jgi:hypothetical protein
MTGMLKPVSNPAAPGLVERAGAGLAAACAWAGIIAQTHATIAVTHDALIAALAMSRYFTILANMAFAVLMTQLALGRRPSAGWIGGVTLCMVTVGVVYALLLEGFLVLPGLGAIASILLHRVSPIAAAAFWILLASKGGLHRGHVLLWLMTLSGYGAYALLRGYVEGAAIYPFLDPMPDGWGRVVVTLVVMGLVFGSAGLGLVELDRRLAPRRRGDAPEFR